MFGWGGVKDCWKGLLELVGFGECVVRLVGLVVFGVWYIGFDLFDGFCVFWWVDIVGWVVGDVSEGDFIIDLLQVVVDYFGGGLMVVVVVYFDLFVWVVEFEVFKGGDDFFGGGVYVSFVLGQFEVDQGMCYVVGGECWWGVKVFGEFGLESGVQFVVWSEWIEGIMGINDGVIR